MISGNTAAVERAAKLADERGAKRAKLLPVSAPFHCSLMKPAQDRLEGDLKKIKMQKPVYPVACNVDADLVTDHKRALRHAGRAGHGIGEVGPVHAPADRARRADVYRSRSGKSSVRIDAADRPLENLPECRR